jgi:hypothetical protein
MSVVGPVPAAAATALPAAAIATGEHPPMPAMADIILALPAIALAATSGSAQDIISAALLDGLGAGVASGIMFIGLAQASAGSGLWRSRRSRPARCFSSSRPRPRRAFRCAPRSARPTDPTWWAPAG